MDCLLTKGQGVQAPETGSTPEPTAHPVRQLELSVVGTNGSTYVPPATSGALVQVLWQLAPNLPAAQPPQAARPLSFELSGATALVSKPAGLSSTCSGCVWVYAVRGEG